MANKVDAPKVAKWLGPFSEQRQSFMVQDGIPQAHEDDVFNIPTMPETRLQSQTHAHLGILKSYVWKKQRKSFFTQGNNQPHRNNYLQEVVQRGSIKQCVNGLETSLADTGL